MNTNIPVSKLLGPKQMFARRNKHYPCRSRQTNLATAVAKFTKPVTKNYFRPSIIIKGRTAQISPQGELGSGSSH